MTGAEFPTMLAFGLGGYELLIFALIALLLFGNRLPSVMRSLGIGITEFKKGIKGEVSENEGGSISDQRPESQSH